jgi:hypothetical protein
MEEVTSGELLASCIARSLPAPTMVWSAANAICIPPITSAHVARVAENSELLLISTIDPFGKTSKLIPTRYEVMTLAET